MRFEFESLVQLAAFTFLGYMVVVNPHISEEFFATLSAWLLLLTVVGGGWPVSVPYGRPFKKLWVTGGVMTLLLLTASTASYALFIVLGLQHLMTAWFLVCANWAFVLDAWPMRHYTPKTAIIAGSVISMLTALALDYLLTLFSVKSPLPLFMVTQLAVAAIFSPFFVFQGYPFYRLWRQPRIGFAILLFSIAAGLGINALPQNIHTLVTPLLSGVLLWSVLFSWSFAYPLSRKYGQPKRGLVTLPLVFVITKDPDNDWVNLGTYRMQLLDKRTLGTNFIKGKHADIMLQKYRERKEPMPVAAVVGADPVLFLVGAARPPAFDSEYDVAGALRGEPVEVVKELPVDLPIPATAEIVVEGEIDHSDVKPEGPFGEYTGYYSGAGAEPRPCMRVNTVYYRDNPIFWLTTVGRAVTDTHI